MESQSGPRPGKLSSSSGLPRGRPPKHGHSQEVVRATPVPENTNNNNNNKYGPMCGEAAEGKRKGRPKAEVQELRSIPATLAEKLSHGCPYCEAGFATKVRLQKHKLWNHPDRVSMEPKDQHPKLHKTPNVKANAKKRPMENSPPSPVFFKVKKTHEVSTPSQNGELARSDRRQQQHSHSHSHSQPPQQQQQQQQPGSLQQSHHHHQHQHQQPVQSPQHSHSHQSTSSDAGGSESEGGSLPPPFHEEDEDPERMRHRRKQKTPKKFTGEQPSISGTFGLKGMTKVEEKLKAGRAKRPEGGSGHSEETQRRSNAGGQASRKEPAPHSSGPPSDAQWQHAISERGEVVCPTCSIVTRKTVHGLKKHMEICQKLQDALKCQQCHKQFRSKAGLNYHTMAEHSTKPSGSEGQTGDEQEERERLRRVLKQMGRIKCPSEGCSAQFSSLMGYQYHQKRCGRELSEDDKPVFLCPHCGKTYRSKAGKDYHVRTEHPAAPNAKDYHHARTEHHPAAPNAKDYHARTEHSAAPNAKDYHARTEHHSTAPNSTANSKDATAATTDTNNNTGKERVICEESPSSGGGGNRKEPSQPDRKEWPERTTTTTTATGCCWPKEKERDTAREKEREKEAREREREREQRDRAKTEQQLQTLKSSSSTSTSMGEDLDRTPSGRVRRRSAQVAVFHLQEIAEDELAKDWGTKRRIKDDLVPDSKRLNYTRPGLPNFSPELLETWKNEVKEKGFICCTNSNCEAVYSSVSGLKAHLANCSQGGGELGKYTCLICQKEFSSESGVKYHISKTHAQNWFRTAAPTHTVTSSSSKSKAPPETPDGGVKAEVRNGATTTTTGKKRGRKPKERPLLAGAADSVVPTTAKTPGAAQNSTPPTAATAAAALSPSSSSTTSPMQTLTTTQTHPHPTHHQNPSLTPTDSSGGSPVLNRQPPVAHHHAPRRGKPKRVLLPPPE